MTKEDLGKEVLVKVGAQILGVNNNHPACIIVLENSPSQMLVVPQTYVDNQDNPQSIPDAAGMLQKALDDPQGWEMIEGLDNPFVPQEEGESNEEDQQ